MRHAGAILLLVVFSFSLIGPVAFAGGREDVPECCRRLGKHHCEAMMSEEGQESSPDAGLHSDSAACPLYSKSGPASPFSPSALPQPSLHLIAAITGYPAVIAQAESRYRISFSRSRQKRGPPSYSC